MRVLDVVWMLHRPNGGVIYEVGTNARDVYEKVVARETMGTGQTMESLKKAGWRAKKIALVLAADVGDQ